MPFLWLHRTSLGRTW